MRELKGLEDFIDVTVVSPRMGEHGWPFANVDPYPGAGPDPVAGAEHIKDLYLKVQPDYSGRYVCHSQDARMDTDSNLQVHCASLVR